MENNRQRYRKGLSPIYLPVYDALCTELSEDWIPYCGLRSFVEQDALWMKGRTLPGRVVTNAKSGESPHNYGMASDWAPLIEGKIQWPPLQNSIWEKYREVVWKVGATWGGTWHDGPHNELKIMPGWKWRECKSIWTVGGQEAVENFIRSKMK